MSWRKLMGALKHSILYFAAIIVLAIVVVGFPYLLSFIFGPVGMFVGWGLLLSVGFIAVVWMFYEEQPNDSR